jgi:hypothetical protein
MRSEPNEYRTLDVIKVIGTISILKKRIADRFPSSGLTKVCTDLKNLAEDSRQKIEWISRPNLWIRMGIGLLILMMLSIIVITLASIDFESKAFTITDLIQGSEAGTNEILLIGAAVYFLFTVETRVKRSRALKVLFELRSIAHVIDMHQLTKDPSRIVSENTPNSPKNDLTPLQLTRYLNYCSELLSLTSKVGALYSQAISDEVVLQTVNEIEDLTLGLSQKIWQKIMVLKELED